MKNGADLGTLPVHLIDAEGVDKLYEALQKGTRVEKRLRQANLCMGHMARAWDVVHRLYPKVVPSNNPFRGVELEHGKATTRAASRAEAYALHQALVAAGEPHLAAVPLICFEWHQRPENVLATVYRHLGINPIVTHDDLAGRPRYILERRETIRELI